MKKILFGTLVFSLILSSLVYAEADAEKMRERREQREKEQQQGIVENSSSVESSSQNVAGATTTNMSSEEEREAYAALERARARIEKEEQEKLKAQQEMAEAQSQMEAQAEVVTEQGANENPDQNQVIFVEPVAPRMTPEEEKEAYEALERVRARILKEDEERAELLKAATEQQVQ
ncbi:hypothetical protein JY402_11570 [Fusobacterium polymorphum]|uniref:hypothetical protein n=1 Tax=Fusobacterium nucleatum subsp. polymorphum TaxID=76857 RepID=UPI001C6E61E4|nr:hypothetical protein [Fusobacterium polymorphum]QYR61171.1 hypothetical protein JY402_11570 [Fusobacterium polymorphum]